MTKTLKDLFEVYKPKVKGEQRFADKHVVVKHKDKNGNGDDVFNATNVKSVDKSPEHGYNAGEDEAVYEDTINEQSFHSILTKHGYKTDDRKTHYSHSNGFSAKINRRANHTVALYDNKGRASGGAGGMGDHRNPEKLDKHLSKIHENTEQLDEISSVAIKRYKGAALDNLNYHSKQWDRLAKLHSFTLGQEKAFDKHDKEAEKRYSGIKRANNRLGKPGHDLKEEDLYELSKHTLGRYIKASSAAAVNKALFDLPATHHMDGDRAAKKKARNDVWRKINNREKGVNKATNKLVREENLQELNRNGALTRYISKTTDDPKRKTGRALALKKRWGDEKYGLPEPKVKAVTRESVEQIDELSKKTLASYINKAAVKNLAHAGSLATQAHDKDENKRKEAEGTAKKLVNKLDGIHRATKRLAKEDVQLDELSKKTLGSYISKAHKNAEGYVKRAGALEKFSKNIGAKHPRNSMEGGKNGMRYRDIEKKIKNRDSGIDRATNKLTKD